MLAFRIMRDTLNRETPLLGRALRELRRTLPETWTVEVLDEAPTLGRGQDQLDAVLKVSPPQGASFAFGVDIKAKIASGAKQAVSRARELHGRPLPVLMVTEYAAPPLRRACEEAGLSYLDTSGWAYLRDDSGLLLRSEGAERAPVDPARRRNEITRLDGPGSSRVVRTLWDANLPIGVRELAIVASVSPGTVTKVLPALERHGAVVRDDAGRIKRLDRGLLLQRWVQDYNFPTTNHEVALFLSPRGIDRILVGLENARLPATLTGYQGAKQYLPPSTVAVVPQTQLVAYTGEPDVLARDLALLPASPQSANVVLVVPRDGSLLRKDVRPAPAPQVIADLLTMGGRYPELGIQVFESLTNQPWTE